MKTSIKNLISTLFTAVLLSGTAYATTEGPAQPVTVLNQVKNINKLVVSGNVAVYLVQAPVESVKVYDSYYSKNALVQQQDGVLRISSFQKEALTIAVYVNNLSAIEVSDNASVTTSAKVNFLSLDILLKDNATADINASTVSLYTSLKGNSVLKLSGYTQDHTSLIGSFATLSMNKFTADQSSVISRSAQALSAKPSKDAELLSVAGELSDLGK